MTLALDINQYEDLAIKISVNSFTLGAIWGPKGIIVGIGATVIDEILDRYNFSPTIRLVPVALSVSSIVGTSQALSGKVSSLTKWSLSAAFGLLTSSGLTVQYPVIEKMVIYGYIGGAIKIHNPKFEYLKVGVGSAGAVVEHYCVHNNLMTYNQIGTVLQGAALVTNLLEPSKVILSDVLGKNKPRFIGATIQNFIDVVRSMEVPVIVGCISVYGYYFSIPVTQSQHQAVELYLEINNITSKIVDSQELALLEKKILLTTASISVLEQYAHINLQNTFMKVRAYPLTVENEQSIFLARSIAVGKLGDITKEALFRTIPIAAAARTIKIIVHKLYTAQLRDKLHSRMNEKLYSPDVVLKLSNSSNKELVVLKEQVGQVMHEISDNGFMLVESYIYTSISAIISYEYLLQANLVSLSVVNTVTSFLLNKLVVELSSKVSSIDNEISNSKSMLVKLEQGIGSVEKEVVLTEGLTFVLDQITTIRKKITELERYKYFIATALYFFSNPVRRDYSAPFWIDTLVPNIFLSYEIMDKIQYDSEKQDKHKRISSITSKILPLLTAVYGVNEYSIWAGNNAKDMQIVRLSVGKLQKLHDYISAPIYYKDIEYVVNKDQAALLVVKNFSLELNEKRLVDIQHLEFSPGIYAVTGKSGSGKTTSLTVMSGYKSTGVMSSGVVQWRNAMSLAFVTQKDYFPTQSTLYQAMLPHMTTSESEKKRDIYEPQIKSWLQDLQVSDDIISRLHEENSWGSILSGGQKKIVSFVRAMLKETNFKIFDETFAGLDPHTLSLMQCKITEYVAKHSDSLMFVIDHEALAHNKTGFYDHCLHFENHTASFVALIDDAL